MATDAADGLADWVRARRHEIERVLDNRVPARNAADDPGRLIEAMRYSLLAHGKRLRPILALGAAEALGTPSDPIHAETILIAAASVELVHCYSLVHDDLPAMDDDDFRRGKPSCHKVFGEATAILTGDALLTLAFEWLAEAGERSGQCRALGRATIALARGAGMNGMVRGQARDLVNPAPVGLAELERLHGEKTAGLFKAALEVGAAAAGGEPTEIDALGVFGYRFGVGFQHADDADDGDHPDHAAEARARLRVLAAEAIAALDGLRNPSRAVMLRGLAGELAARA